MAGVSDPRGLLPVASGDLVKRAILESTHIRDSKLALFTVVQSRLVMVAGCL